MAVLALLIVVLLAVARVRHLLPPTGSDCTVQGRNYQVTLSPDQAGIASTIAGVAGQHAMGVHAVTIAYATALQESHLQNLDYGDRDSVGVFQQRPSQGWGPRRDLLDPVYASRKFFAALALVPGYRAIGIAQAAQAVQHSADGSAYGQYIPEASILSAAFTGQAPRSVWCWYSDGASGRARLAAADRQLIKVFGRVSISRQGDPTGTVRVDGAQLGWSIAIWLVSNAGSYGISYVRYQGYQWKASQGQRGWTRYHTPGHDHAPGNLTVAYG